MFQTSINQGSEIISHLNKNTILDSHDKKIKDARQYVDGAMDVLLRILQDSGVAVAAINELRQDVSDGKCKRVLHCAQKYLSCTEPCNGASFFVLTGWETLNRLDTLRFRQALKIVRCIKLGGKNGNIRRANFNLQIFAEECAASQLGLYKAQAWKHRMEKKGTGREKQPMIAAAHNQKDFGTSEVNSLSCTNPEARDIRVGGHYRTDCFLKF